MTLSFFRKVVNREHKILPLELQAVLKGDSQVEFTKFRPMTTDIQVVVYQILNASSNAFPWPLYLEGKSLELLSLYLAALGLDCRQSYGQLLNMAEKEKVSQARTLLINDLQTPPTLNRLCRKTGLNAAKLQAGFRQVYGKSVFDYFREHRMQEAKRILDKAETNVSQTAWQVGYTNVSHFSEAFKKRFGILPKHYLKNRVRDVQAAL
ncbi:helix-turn-helix transcriptional regulator [Desulfotignum balticum]|jgi:AraC-like DNA-binding protein|uniref:helix-turn-helix transcriptional regulator n=1 Tax=Desulfotignum balticum TaxID=115781 RepID=UPI000401E524|nr:AraC family transcriptional regulator [Desulfotignum balticum]